MLKSLFCDRLAGIFLVVFFALEIWLQQATLNAIATEESHETRQLYNRSVQAASRQKSAHSKRKKSDACIALLPSRWVGKTLGHWDVSTMRGVLYLR
jgi:hypothetical protein